MDIDSILSISFSSLDKSIIFATDSSYSFISSSSSEISGTDIDSIFSTSSFCLVRSTILRLSCSDICSFNPISSSLLEDICSSYLETLVYNLSASSIHSVFFNSSSSFLISDSTIFCSEDNCRLSESAILIILSILSR